MNDIADPVDSSEAVWSGSTLLSKAMPILVQQSKGCKTEMSDQWTSGKFWLLYYLS